MPIEPDPRVEPVKVAIVDATGDAAGRCDLTGGPRFAIPIANLPLICHVLDDLAEAGVAEATIVAKESLRSEVERAVGDGRAWGMAVAYSETPDTDGRRGVLAEIDRALSDGPVLVHPGDCLFPGQLPTMLARLREGAVDLVTLESPLRTPTPGHGGGEDISRFLDTAAVLSPQTRPGVDELLATSRDAPDLIDSLRARHYRVAVCALGDYWEYNDSTDALLRANRMMLDALPVPAMYGGFGSGNAVEGRVAISPKARVSNCTIHGPTVVDADAVLEDSFIGPYTAIGPTVTVSGAEIDNSMILAGAEVRFPGQRIESSIIGERASVARSFDIPKGLHLRLGPASRVILS